MSSKLELKSGNRLVITDTAYEGGQLKKPILEVYAGPKGPHLGSIEVRDGEDPEQAVIRAASASHCWAEAVGPNAWDIYPERNTA